VKRLSEINMGLATLLLLFVILVGPTLMIITGFFEYLWAYVTYAPALSMPLALTSWRRLRSVSSASSCWRASS
jgi:choline-glycine betaine transporter